MCVVDIPVKFRSEVVISTQEQRKWVRRSDSDDALTLLDHFSSLVGEGARLISSLKEAEAPDHIFSLQRFYCFYKFCVFAIVCNRGTDRWRRNRRSFSLIITKTWNHLGGKK